MGSYARQRLWNMVLFIFAIVHNIILFNPSDSVDSTSFISNARRTSCLSRLKVCPHPPPQLLKYLIYDFIDKYLFWLLVQVLHLKILNLSLRFRKEDNHRLQSTTQPMSIQSAIVVTSNNLRWIESNIIKIRLWNGKTNLTLHSNITLVW